jgi:hypothetical protein
MKNIKIHNVETGEIIERAMTSEEIAQLEKLRAENEALLNAEAQAAAKRQALLDKLGITEDEARLLLGGN